MDITKLIQPKPRTESVFATNCSVCGALISDNNDYCSEAEIFPFTERQSCSFMFCCRDCEQAFLSHPLVDEYIMAHVTDTARLHHVELLPEFAKWFELLSTRTKYN